MKYVGLHEFQEHATQYLSGNEILVIERHGVPLGYYLPASSQSQKVVRKGSKEAKEAREQLERTIEKVLDRTGYTEEQLSRLFDLSVPIDQAISELAPPQGDEDGSGQSASDATAPA